MAEIMGNWPSGHGQITKIWPSDRCGGKTIPAAMQFGYNLREFGGYLGNVGYNTLRPHSVFAGRTPEEVHTGRDAPSPGHAQKMVPETRAA